MKKLKKALACLLVIAICVIFMVTNVFARGILCYAHLNDPWYTYSYYENGVYKHDYCCSVCHDHFDTENCTFFDDKDCTSRPMCNICYQYDYSTTIYACHNFPDTWSYNSYMHYKTCGNTGCIQEISDYHDYEEVNVGGTVILVCNVCGREK